MRAIMWEAMPSKIVEDVDVKDNTRDPKCKNWGRMMWDMGDTHSFWSPQCLGASF